MKNAKNFTLTNLPALGVNQILLEHGQADQECVLLLRLDLGQVAAQVLTQLLALSPGEASGCKHLVMIDGPSVICILASHLCGGNRNIPLATLSSPRGMLQRL